MKRRHFFSTTLCSTAGWLTSYAGDIYQPLGEDMVRISICHTTDLHGNIVPTESYDGLVDVGGFGRCLSQIRKWRQENPNHITLDIGDLYQGTHVSLESEGEIMVKLLNAAGYDAWVPGNHDFDWGEEVFRKAVLNSAMPVISANLQVDGQSIESSQNPGSLGKKLLPTLVKEISGIKIGIFGITTPGLPFWLNPGQLGSVVALDPLAEARKAIHSLKEQGVHCIIAAGHMGLKQGDLDDYANQVNRIIRNCPEIDLFLAGHTHRDRPSTMIGNTLFTQAGYYGIWAGLVDLTFLKEGAKLIRRDAETVLMDKSISIDPLVLQIAGDALKKSQESMQIEVGSLEIGKIEEGDFNHKGLDTQSLIASGIFHVLKKKGVKIDGVLHGAFSEDPIVRGAKTIADMWKIIPYENRVVTANVTGEQLMVILEEAFTNRFGKRRLVGFDVESEWDATNRIRKVKSVFTGDGKPLLPHEIYRIAFNSYDAQSGGRTLLVLRETLLSPSANTQYHPVDTRAALTDFFLDSKVVTAEAVLKAINR